MRRVVAIGLVGALLLASGVAARQGNQAQDEVKYNGKTVSEWLLLLKKSEKPKVRQALVLFFEALGPAADPRILPSVADVLKEDKDAEVRATAAPSLARIGLAGKVADATRASKALTDALKDPAPEVRTAAAKALGGKLVEYAHEDVIPTLAATLRDKDAGTRAAAAAALRAYGEDAAKVLPQLLEAAADAKLDDLTRIYCIQLVTTHSDDAKKVVPILTGVLADKDANLALRKVAVEGLAEYHRHAGPAADQLLVIFKDDKAPTLLRQSAAGALAKIQPDPKKVWAVVKPLIKHEDALIRAQAMRLGAKVCYAEPELVPMLIERCNDDSVDTQIAAIQELGELGPAARAAENTLKRLAEMTTRQSVREAAELALKKIAGSGQ